MDTERKEMKLLMFDLEHGSKTLGNPKYIEETFGLPLLAPTTWDQYVDIIGKIYTKKTKIVEIPLGTITIPEEQTIIIPKDGIGVVNGIIIDTFSELSKKYMRQISDAHGKMKIQGWGQLKNKLDGALDFITAIPGIVVCNCHSKIRETDEGTKMIPYVDGSTREDISKWFDFVFYTKTIVDRKTKERVYTWVTKRSEYYNDAKDRTDLLPEEIPQNYQLVLDVVKEKDFDGMKILIIGAPGSGKTMSLETLVKGKE